MAPDEEEVEQMEELYAEFEEGIAEEMADEFDTIPTNIV